MSHLSIHEPEALQLVYTLLSQGISVQIRVSGDSMQPFLQGGELLKICPLQGKKPKLGELLLFYNRHNRPLVHRVIWRRYHHHRLYLQTKGDASSSFDGFIPVEQVMGYVQQIIRSDFPPKKGKIIHLHTLSQRIQGLGLVLRTLIFYALRKKEGQKNMLSCW